MTVATSSDDRPFRVPVKEAAQLLRMHPETLRALVATGIFTIIPYRAGERGVGKRYYLLTEEVEIYGKRGEEALREFRARSKSSPKRGSQKPTRR